MSAIVATAPGRQDLVRAVCVREWREALGNKLLVGMTLLPPVVILFTGIAAVAAAAINPPSERDVQALYSAAPAVLTILVHVGYLVAILALYLRPVRQALPPSSPKPTTVTARS